MNYLYLFRHAESEDNENHLFSGWRDPSLSTKGKIDCEELAELLKEKEFKVAYSPDLKRNLDTLKEIFKYHKDTEVVVDKRIRERSYGDLQGKPHLEIMRDNLELYLKYHRSYDSPPPNGESIQMVEIRVKPFYEEVISRIKKEKSNVAVCAGNNAMRVLRKYLENLNIQQMILLENPYDNFFEYKIND